MNKTIIPFSKSIIKGLNLFNNSPVAFTYSKYVIVYGLRIVYYNGFMFKFVPYVVKKRFNKGFTLNNGCGVLE